MEKLEAHERGSSPQTRGTPLLYLVRVEDERFIPTDAGNTIAATFLVMYGAVHPHRRGEHFETANVSLRFIGSSPQTRGTRVAWCCIDTGQRFIPTDAGNTI